MSVIVASCSLNTLFGDGVIIGSDGTPIEGVLTIPEYQRPYCWDSKQIKRLLEDYRYFVEKEKGSFYLGSLILHQSEDGKLNIIDGQQRLTTLALLSTLQGVTLPLSYHSPESQHQIRSNWKWLQNLPEPEPLILDLKKIQFTLVVTQSEDDAYQFFETQNTGGVRLSGPDIIKAYHLRAIKKSSRNRFARKWEELGDLEPVVKALLRGRYWEKLHFREVPSQRQSRSVRDHVVREFAEQTELGPDRSFGPMVRWHQLDGGQISEVAQSGYAMRQPLNAGMNGIHYLAYFEGLRQRYLEHRVEHLPEFSTFYQELIRQLPGCNYLKHLFDSALLLYLSQFGEADLEVAAKKLFRVVYARRVSNQKSVREKSVPAFVKEHPVLDWIAHSYTPEQCMTRLDAFALWVDGSNLDANSVKKRFMRSVCDFFKLKITDGQLANEYKRQLNECIKGLKPAKEQRHV